MDEKDREILEYNKRFLKKILKAMFFTFLMIVAMQIMSFFFAGFNEMFTVFIGLIFTIFYSMLTIIDEIRKVR